MKIRIPLGGCFVLALAGQCLGGTGELYWPIMYWGETAKNQVTSAFGVRDGEAATAPSNWFHYGIDIQAVPVTYDRWTLINPYNEDAKITWYYGSNDVQWFTMAPWYSFSIHPVKKVIFWHTDNSKLTTGYDSKAYAPQAVLDASMKDLTPFGNYANHCHFETMEEDIQYVLTGNSYYNRIMKTKNPLQWLDVDNSYEGAWGFSQAGGTTPTTNRYVQYAFDNTSSYSKLIITTAEHKRALTLNRVTVNVLNVPSYSWLMGTNYYDMNDRHTPIFADLAANGAEKTALKMYDNQEYYWSRVDAKPWAMTDADKKKIDWYFYQSGPFSSSTQFQVQIDDVSGGGTWTSSTFTPPTVVCPPSGCPPEVPLNPPQTLTATAVAGGIQISWSSLALTNGGYLIYRRPASTPDIQSAKPLILVPREATSYLDAFVDANPITPGAQYKYSIATVDSRGESCNGPFVAGCSGSCNCAVAEKTASMPTTLALTGTLQATATRFPVTISGGQTSASQNVVIKSASIIRINPETALSGEVKFVIDPTLPVPSML